MSKLKKFLPLLVVIFFATLGVCLAAQEPPSEARKIWDMVWRIINFTILVVILYRLLADRIRKYFVDRRTEIVKVLDEVERAEKEAQKRYEESRVKLEEVEKDIENIRNMLIGEIEKEKARIIEEGKSTSERIIEQAKSSAQQEVSKAEASLREMVADMACNMASDIISRQISKDDQKRIIREYLDKVVTEN
ncbi:MAG: ATP synthase F0 subunit B [Deltaproteobacteria bacterium]|nr:ATP synthase F0 subunit B [Deltaproteobacteria bacterium]